MKRFLAAMIIDLLAAGLVGAATPQKAVKITWHGQSFFEITSSKGTTVVIDPHAIIEYGRIDGVYAHLILNSHLHNDHTQNQVVENYITKEKEKDREAENKDKADDKDKEKERERRSKWPQPKLIQGLKQVGTRQEWNVVNEKFRDFRIRSVGTYHDDVEGMKRGKNTVFILEVDGIRIVHLGDLGHLLSPEQVRAIGRVDVLLIPVGGIYTLNGSDAKEVVEQLKPKKYIIPMHCGTRVYEDLLSPKEFLEDQKRENVVVSSDNTLVVRVDYKPAEPIIVVLNWEAAPKRKRREQ
jgi:L-ascorbate metabolism protein UlaG (beta-lactamase superfamily)